MKAFSCLVTVRDGKLKLFDKRGFERSLAQFGDGQELDLTISEIDRKRTAQQNKFWHAVVIPLFSEHCGYELDEMKEALSLKLIPQTVRDMDGNEQIVPGHTSALTVKEFNDLIERVQRLGAELDILIPDPDPAWRSAA